MAMKGGVCKRRSAGTSVRVGGDEGDEGVNLSPPAFEGAVATDVEQL